MTTLDMPAEKLNSTTDGDFKFLDVYGKTWQTHPEWEPGDPWENKYVYPEDEGYQTIGWQALEWLQTYINSPNGTGRLRLTPEQQRFLLHWYSFDPETEIPRYREGVLVRPKGPIVDNETVPTPSGPVRHGDLAKGSEVFASDGSITEVTAVIDRDVTDEAVRLTFSDGSTIECSIDHRFPVGIFNGRGRVDAIVTPREMLEAGLTFERKLTKGKTKATKGGVSRYRMKESPAREGRHADFVIDPYIFGYWLGDGDKDGPRITCHSGELDWLMTEFHHRGMTANRPQNTHGETYRFGFGNGVALNEMRRLGVHMNKHIPREYMSASFDQRLEVLRGIVDSDGHVEKGGVIEVSLRADDNLAADVIELCHSLGLHPKTSYGKTYLNGRNYSERARIKFVSMDFYCALLPRKREREVKVGKKGVAAFSRSRTVRSIESIGERQVSCIEVAHPSHEYLVGRSGIPVGNSGKDPLAAMLCILEFVGPCRLGGWSADGEPIGVAHPNPLVQLAAVSKEQNTNTSSLFPVMLDQAAQDLFEINLGVELSYAQKRKSTMKMVTSSFRTLEGSRPSCVIANEVHHWLRSQGGFDLYEVLGRNLNKRGDSDSWARRLSITNAFNASEESVARMIRESYEDAQAGRSVDTGRLLYDSLEVRADVPLVPPEDLWTGHTESGAPAASLEDRIQWLMELLKEVRGDAFWLNARQTAEEILSPQNQNAISQSRRFYLNQTLSPESSWLDRADIRAAIDPRIAHQRKNVVSAGVDAFEVGWQKVSPSDPVVLFFDGSKSNDATALVGCRVSDGYVFTVGVWQMPGNLPTEEKETWRVKREDVDARVKKAMARFTVVAFWADPSHAKDESDYSPYWDALLDSWHERYSEDLKVWAVRNNVGGHAIQWDMVSPARTAEFVAAAQKTVEDFQSLDITIDGHPALVAHLNNSQEREDEKNGITLGKESRYSPRKIDLAVCLVGARMLARVVKLGGHDDNGAGNFWGA